MGKKQEECEMSLTQGSLTRYIMNGSRTIKVQDGARTHSSTTEVCSACPRFGSSFATTVNRSVHACVFVLVPACICAIAGTAECTYESATESTTEGTTGDATAGTNASTHACMYACVHFLRAGLVDIIWQGCNGCARLSSSLWNTVRRHNVDELCMVIAC